MMALNIRSLNQCFSTFSPSNTTYRGTCMRRIFLFAFATLFTTSLHAQQLVGGEGAWRVFTLQQGSKKICYMAASPEKSRGTFKKRGDAYLLLTHKTASQDEVNASSGYPYKTGADVHITFNTGKKFRLFTQGDQAWARDGDADSALVGEMIKGSSLTLRGTSKIGSYSEDTYSLKGFSKARDMLKNACK